MPQHVAELLLCLHLSYAHADEGIGLLKEEYSGQTGGGLHTDGNDAESNRSRAWKSNLQYLFLPMLSWYKLNFVKPHSCLESRRGCSKRGILWSMEGPLKR